MRLKKRKAPGSSPGGFSDDLKRIHISRVFRGIEPSSPMTAWVIILPDGEERLALWHKDATFDDVYNACKVYHPEGFKLGAMGTGEFVIAKHVSSIRFDSRYVDQDGWVSSGMVHAPDPFPND